MNGIKFRKISHVDVKTTWNSRIVYFSFLATPERPMMKWVRAWIFTNHGSSTHKIKLSSNWIFIGLACFNLLLRAHGRIRWLQVVEWSRQWSWFHNLLRAMSIEYWVSNSDHNANDKVKGRWTFFDKENTDKKTAELSFIVTWLTFFIDVPNNHAWV